MEYALLRSPLRAIAVGVLSLFGALLIASRAEAAIITWDGGGADTNWATCENWSSNVCPGSVDIATFDATSTKNATIAAPINVAGIDINTGYTGIITQGAGQTITVGSSALDQADGTFNGGNSTIDINGAFVLSGTGSFTSTTATMFISGAFTHTSGGTFTNNNGSVAMDGGTSTIDVSTSETFYNFEIRPTGGQTKSLGAGDTLVVTNTLTLTDGLFTVGTINAKKDVVIASTWDGSAASGTLLIDGSAVGTGTFNPGTIAGIADTVTINNSNFTMQGGGTGTIFFDVLNLQAGTLNTTGVSANFNGTFTLSGGTFTNGSSTQTINGAFNQTSGIFNGGTGALDFNGTWTLSGGTFTATSGSMNLSGAFTHTAGGTFAHNNGTFIYDGGTSAMDVATSETFYNFEIRPAGGQTKSLGAGDTLVVTNTLTLTDGLFTVGTINAKKDVVIASTWDGSNASGTLLIDGTNVATGTYTPGSNVGIADTVTINNPNFTFQGTGTSVINFDVVNLQAGVMNFQGNPVTVASAFTQSGGTFESGATGPKTFSGAFSLSNGTFNGGSVTVDHNSTWSLTGGTYNATTGTTYIGGTYTHGASGTLNHNNGTVRLDGGTYNIDIAGTSESFYNLTIDGGNLSNKTIINSKKIIVNGLFTGMDGSITSGTVELQGSLTTNASFDGLASPLLFSGNQEQTITLGSTGAITTSSMTIDKAGGSVTLASSMSNSGVGVTIVNGTFNAGNGTFLTGTFNQQNGIFNGGSAAVTHVFGFTLSGGTYNATTGTTQFNSTYTHTAGGTFNHMSGTAAFGSTNAVIDVANTETFYHFRVAKSTGQTLTISGTDVIIAAGNLTLSDGLLSGGTAIEVQGDFNNATTWDGGTTVLKATGSGTQTIYDNGGNGYDTDIIVNKTGGSLNLGTNLILNGSSQDLFLVGGTLDLNGFNITVNGTSGQFVVGAKLRLQGAESITANVGHPQLDTGSTVEYYGTSGPYTLKNYGNYKSITIAGGSSTVFNLPGPLSLGQNLTLTSGILSQNNYGLTVAGTFSNNSTLRRMQGEPFTGVMDTDSGTVEYVGDGDGTPEQSQIADSGTTDYFNLRINDVSATKDAFTISADLTIAGTLQVSSGTMSAPGNALSAGTILVDGGVLTGGSGAITAQTAFTLSGGTMNAPAGFLNIDGSYTHTAGGTFNPNGGTVRFRANASGIDVASNETFNNVTVFKGDGQTLTIANDDTMIVSGTATFADGNVAGGTVEARGAVNVGINFDSGSSMLKFGGSNPQTFTLTGAEGRWDGDIEIGKSSGTVTLASGLTMNTVGQDLTLIGGELATGNYPLALTGNLNAVGGTLTLNGSTVDIDGNVTFLGGTVNFGTATVTLAGDLAYTSGTMTPGTSSVTLDGTNQQITGDTSFYNFTKQATSSPLTLTLGAGNTLSVTGTFTLLGGSATNRLSLRSTVNGTKALMNPSGTVTQPQYLDVQDNQSNGASMRCTTGCQNSGNNQGWVFTVSGDAPSSSNPTASSSLDITSPSAGTEIAAGATTTIRWTSEGVSFVNVWYSLDGGTNWTSLASKIANSKAYLWTVPNADTEEAVIKVEATDLTTVFLSDSSSEFTIVGTTEDDPAAEEDCPEHQEEIEEIEERIEQLPEAAKVHGLVKLADDSAVYYIGADGLRHAFPNEKVYFSWFNDFSGVQIISRDDLADIGFGANITYRPGARMVKFQTSPKVYAVDQFGILRWVASESIAREIYGDNWNTKIDDLSDAFFKNYEFGNDLTDATEYNPSEKVSGVTYPSDSIEIPGYSADLSQAVCE